MGLYLTNADDGVPVNLVLSGLTWNRERCVQRKLSCCMQCSGMICSNFANVKLPMSWSFLCLGSSARYSPHPTGSTSSRWPAHSWYPWCLHRKAFEIGTPSQRKWICLELWANCLWIGIVFLVLDCSALQYHVLAMATGQCFTAFFAVWTTHHGCPREGPIARTIRNRFKAFITYNMFYHFEHHTFPSVPTCKLPVLARRLDASVTQLQLTHVY